MNVLADAAIGLLKRERAVVVAATGLIFDAMASRWRAAALEEVLESWRGGAWGKETPPGVGFPVLRSTNMRGKRVDPTDPAWVDVQPKLAAACALRPGDILVTKSSGSEDLVGKAALFVGADDEFPYLFSNFTLRLRPNRTKVRPEYLAWFLRSPQALMWRYASQETAVGLRNLQVGEYLQQDIPLPPVDYQTSVVAFLDDVESKVPATDARIPDDLCEQRRIVARIEELAAGMAEATGVREVARRMSGALASNAARAVISTANPQKMLPLGDVVTMQGGGTPAKSNPLYWEGNFPWVTPKDMKTREIRDAIDHISEHATRETAAKRIEPGAVLVVVRGMILVHTFPSAVLRVAAAINQDMKALLPSKALSPEYLSAVFWARNAEMVDLVGKSSHDTRKLETNKLLSFAIPVPSREEQHRIVAELDALQTKVDELKRLQSETQAELDALLPSILDRAFKGEL